MKKHPFISPFTISAIVVMFVPFLTWSSTQINAISLRFSASEPLQGTPSVQISEEISGVISCNTPIDVSRGAGTQWIVECYTDITLINKANITINLQYRNSSEEVLVISQVIGVSQDDADRTNTDTSEIGNETNQKNQNASGQDNDVYSDLIDESWLTPQVTQTHPQTTDDASISAISEYDEYLCNIDGINICTRIGDLNFMQFHRHLACSQIVIPQPDCTGAGCSIYALRQEVAGMAVRLGRHRLVNTHAYTARFSDLDYENSNWITGIVETGLKHQFISPLNDVFRPRDVITRAEAYGMFLKSACVNITEKTGNWHVNVYATALEQSLTIRDYLTFDPDVPILRQEAFVIASRLLDYVNETGGCYEKLMCE